MPGVESSVDSVVPATLIPSITTFPLLEVKVRSALLGAPIVDPVNVKSLTLTLAISVSTYALMLCCVANSVALSLEKLSSSAMPVTVAPDARASEVDDDNAPDTVAVPSTIKPSFILIVLESSALIVVPFNLRPDAITPPVPLGASVISALLGELMVEPTKLKSPTDTDPNDKTPAPFVCRTWFAVPSDEGRE